MTSTGNISEVSQRRKTKCPVCGSRNICPSDGFMVCTTCGTCQDREMVQGFFTFHESGHEGAKQYTDIGNKTHMVNTQGSQIGHSSERQSILMTSKVLRLKRVHSQTMLKKQERLYQGLIWINKVAAQLHLPTQTRDRAAYLLRKLLPSFNIHRSKTPLVICVMTLAIREHQLPVREIEVVDLIPLRARTKNQLNRTKFFIMEHLGISWPSHRPECFIPGVISTIRKNPRVLGRLERKNGTLDYFNRLERLSTKLLQSMTFNDFGGRYPAILAASAVYTIDSRLLHVMSQKDVSETVGTVEVSIRSHHNDLWKPKSDQIKKLLEEVGA